jgi:dolichyl-phosphate beta-glucosyltransferase
MTASETSTGRDALAVTDNSPPVLSIIVPAFNEAARISGSIQKIQAYMHRSRIACELIVVDDGSADNTADVLKTTHVKDMRVVRNDVNHGKGYAVRQGVLAASGQYVLFTDADLSAPIEEADKLLEVAVNEGVDIVIGSRAIDRRYIEKRQSLVRELSGIIFNRMVRLLLGLRLHDTQCGFKLFDRQKSRPIFEMQRTDGFGFDPELLFLANRRGLKIRETPVRWSHAEGSKISLFRDSFSMFFEIVRIRWNAMIGRYS